MNAVPTQKQISRNLGKDWEKVKKANRIRLFKRSPNLFSDAATVGVREIKDHTPTLSLVNMLRMARKLRG